MFIADTINHKIKVFAFDTGEVYSLEENRTRYR
jgi:hypothetical protein